MNQLFVVEEAHGVHLENFDLVCFLFTVMVHKWFENFIQELGLACAWVSTHVQETTSLLIDVHSQEISYLRFFCFSPNDLVVFATVEIYEMSVEHSDLTHTQLC